MPTCFNHLAGPQLHGNCACIHCSVSAIAQTTRQKPVWRFALLAQIEAQTSLGNRSGCAQNGKEKSLLLALRTQASSLWYGSPPAGLAPSINHLLQAVLV